MSDTPHLALHNSMRKRAIVEVSAAPVPTLRSQRSDDDDAEEDNLIRAAQRNTQVVFQYVRRLGEETRDPLYLPKSSDDRTNYKHLSYLRAKHQRGELEAADYQLLARLPRILGPAVYGAVEECADGYRWTFAPAGVEVRGDVFPTKAAAAEDHRPLQQALYPGWEDPGQRASHLQRLISFRAQQRRLGTLVQRPALASARPLLTGQSSSADPNSPPPADAGCAWSTHAGQFGA